MKTTIWNTLVHSVGLFGNRPIFWTSPNSYIKYNQFYDKITSFSQLLEMINIQKGDKVMLTGPNSINWAAVNYAILSKGGVVVPTFANQSDNILDHMLKTTNAKLLFNSSGKKIGNNIMEFNHENILDTTNITPSENFKHVNIDPSSTAYILFTSGTSGLPKGVPLTHTNILSNIEATKTVFKNNFSEHDKYVSFLPWNHCYGLNCELNYMMSTGASTYINTNIKNVMSDIQQHNPTGLCTVPKFLHQVRNKINKIEQLPTFMKPYVNPYIKRRVFGKNIKFCTVGGSHISKDDILFYKNLGLDIYQGYGTTECSPMISLNGPNGNKIGSVGKILHCNNIQIQHNDEYNELIDENMYNTHIGNILVSGSNVMKDGYLHNAKESIVYTGLGMRYNTGDIGYIKDDYLYIVGRNKDQYKLSNGKFINPTDIENELLKISEIDQVLVYPSKNGKYNKAIIVSSHSYETIQHKINNMNNELKKYEIPQEMIVTDEQFTTDNNMLTQKQSMIRSRIIKKYDKCYYDME